MKIRFNKFIVNFLVLRGVDVYKCDFILFFDLRFNVSWVFLNCVSIIWCYLRLFNYYEKFVILLSNS